MRSTPTAADWTALARTIAGDVILPGTPDYDSARKPAFARFDDVLPQAVVRCRAPADVAETIALARRHRLHAVPRSGGHCFAGRSTTSGVIIDVTPMRDVRPHPDGEFATVGAGARLGEVYDGLDRVGRTIPAGCGPTVGIAGLTLGGGLGILGRSHGLTCDHLVAAEVGLADGTIVECDDRREPDLFWALRGAGGGNFGVVTSLTLRTVVPPLSTAFHLAWPAPDAAGLAAIIEAWQQWSPPGPDELAASLLVTVPGDPDRPIAAHVFGAVLDAESDAWRLLGELVARCPAAPDAAEVTPLPYRRTKTRLAELGDEVAGAGPDHPVSSSRSEFFDRPLPAPAIAALARNLGRDRRAGQWRELDFTPWGGAYNRTPAAATAFAHRGSLFLLKHAVGVPSAAGTEDRQAARAWLAASWSSVRPVGSGRVYPNFPDPGLPDWARAYHGSNYDRLRRVKARYDPEGFFRFPQAIGSAP